MPGDLGCSQKYPGDLFRVDLDHKLKVEFIFYDVTYLIKMYVGHQTLEIYLLLIAVLY